MSDAIDYVSLLGRPFDPDHWTCWQLCREIYRRRGVALPDYPYSADPETRAALASSVVGRFVRLPGPQPWAIVAVSQRCAGGSMGIIHTGVVLPDLVHILHVREQCGTVLTRLDHLKHSIEGYYEYNA